MKQKVRNLIRLGYLLCFLLGINNAFAQEGVVTGTVTDEADGSTMPGVSILVKGTSTGAITDIDGKFKVKIGQKSTLVVSFIGYTSKEVEVEAGANVSVKLKVEAKSLDEVVVIGYGSVKKTDATGSVTAVSSKDFNKGAITSPQDLLVGKSAGVVITTGGGAPGSGATIRIRGGSSLSASNDPLIVVDNIPLNNEGISGMSNPLSSINPNDIETMTVLKDASATAIYGSRASNGVIIITTKKGGKKFKISYDANMSVSTLPAKVDVLSGDQFRALLMEKYGTNSSALALVGRENTNWQKEIFRTAVGTDHNLSFSGTAKKLPYRASIGYTDQDGILDKSNFKRVTGTVNLSPKFLDDNLSVNLNLKGIQTNQNFSNEGAIGTAIGFDPTQPIRVTNGYGNFFTWLDAQGSPIALAPSNPVALIEMTDNTSKVLRSIGNLQLDYKMPFLPELRANLNLGYDYYTSEGHNVAPVIAPWTNNSWKSTEVKGSRNLYDQKGKNELLDFYLNYVKQLDALKSKIDLTAGYSHQYFWRQSNAITYNDDRSSYKSPDSTKTQLYLISFFGRLNYTIADKYLFTFTLRNDGSSRFSKDNRWGLFPAAAFAWKLNEEGFIKNSGLFNDLKLRLGYGVTGQQDIGSYYPALATYSYSQTDAQYQFGNSYYKTLRPNAYDPNIKWEETTTYNAGLDFSILKERISGSVDIYQRKTKDLLNYIPIAAGANFSNYLWTNVGDMENNGIEVALNFRPISTKEMSWDVSTNFSYNKNEITKLTVVDDPNYLGVPTGGIGGGVGNNIQMNSVGYSKNSFFVFKQVYDANGKPIDALYADLSGKGGNVVSNVANKYHYKKADPDYTIGVSSKFHYKNWDFSFSGRANVGNYVYNNVASGRSNVESLVNPNGFLNNVPTYIYNTMFTNVQYWSDYFVENASFFRMDNISLAYRVPQIFSFKASLGITATVQNAFVITKYSGLDPEVSGGIDNTIYPRPRVFMLGISLNY